MVCHPISRRLAVVLLALIFAPSLAGAEPIKLKLSFFTSDRSIAYQAAVKPFVDAINRDGKGLLQIEVFPSGTLGRVQKELPQLVLNGDADIAFIVPGQNPERFSDNTVIELPGLFHNGREATLVHTRLAAAGALKGYEDFFVIGAYATDPETIHSRKPLASLADLKGQKIRTNNLTEAAGLAKLGALPIVLAFNETTNAISSGMIDGATVPTAQLFDIGIGRIAGNDYLLPTGSAPLTLMMRRKTFDALPVEAKALILKYSGEWTAAAYIDVFEKLNKTTLEEINADARRKVVMPSASDTKAAQDAFRSVAADWAAANPHNRELLEKVNAELAKLRAEK
jgi:TRAP-type C4-dicarboxylate transport system substrate-binding protein